MASNSYIVRTSDDTGAWGFGSGLNNFAQNNAAVQQNIPYSLNMLFSECFFATNKGIDWWGLLGGKSVVALSLAINSTLLSVPGVTGILQSDINLDPVTRHLTLSYRVQTQYGTLSNTFVYSAGANPAA